MCSSDAPLPAIELAFTMSVRQLLVFLCGRVLTEGVELARVVAVERLLAVALLAELRDWVLLVADRCYVENGDVVGEAPTGDAPTTSKASKRLLPTKLLFYVRGLTVPMPFRVSLLVLAIALLLVKLSEMGKRNKIGHLKLSYANRCLSIKYVAGYAREMYNDWSSKNVHQIMILWYTVIMNCVHIDIWHDTCFIFRWWLHDAYLFTFVIHHVKA